MKEDMLAALKTARSAEQVAEAFDAGVEAAYRSHPRDGYAAAMEVLTRPAPAVEAAVEAAAEPTSAVEPVTDPEVK